MERIATHALVPENVQDANLCTTKSEELQIANTAPVIVLHAELIMRNAQVAIQALTFQEYSAKTV